MLCRKKLKWKPTNKELSEISSDEMILDIGPKTIKLLIILLIKVILFYGMDLLDILKILTLLMAVLKLLRR